MGCNNSLNDLKMRNEFLHCLANCIERGKLSAPFDMDPAKGPIKTMANLLVHKL